jgi:hypothetical protein
MFVLGMLSNGPVSIWGDRTLRCGYRKGSATIVRHGFHRYEIRRGQEVSALSAQFSAIRQGAWAPVDARLDGYRPMLSQPLLGYVSHDAFAVTFLDRFLEAPDVRWAPVSGQLAVAGEFIEGVPGGQFGVHALSPEYPWGAFQTARLPVKVTFPHRA